MKTTIQNEYILAMKSKNESAKKALGDLKTKITESEKLNGNQPLGDSDITKLITKLIKQREESAKFFKDAGRDDLYEKEMGEVEVLRKFLPKQLTESEITEIVNSIIGELKNNVLNNNVLIGKTIGEFNKKYQGCADINLVKQIIQNIVN